VSVIDVAARIVWVVVRRRCVGIEREQVILKIDVPGDMHSPVAVHDIVGE
jgi:hypothetical protein